MNKQSYMNIMVGLFMIGSLLAFIVMVIKVSGVSELNHQKSYTVSAEFNDIGGLKVRAPVTIAGVKIGEVTNIELKAQELSAKVTMALRKDKPIPYEDTQARILTEGLLGSNYISIVPGFESEDSNHMYLAEGDVIAKTQQAIILENLIGQLLFNIKK